MTTRKTSRKTVKATPGVARKSAQATSDKPSENTAEIPVNEPSPEGETQPENAKPDAMRQRSFYLADSLHERMRAAVWACGRLPGEAENGSQLVARAIAAELDRLEQRYNRGKPFPPPPGRLPSGPSIAGAMRGARLRAEARATEPEADREE